MQYFQVTDDKSSEQAYLASFARCWANPNLLCCVSLSSHREWPMQPWGIHSDNGQEFLNAHLKTFCASNQFRFSRSRPYRKNDNAHVEQKNGFLVRQLVGYERYDRPEQVEWLNSIYALHDRYFNFCLPTCKLIGKERHGARVKKTFDTAKTPVARLIESGVGGTLPWRGFLRRLWKKLAKSIASN